MNIFVFPAVTPYSLMKHTNFSEELGTILMMETPGYSETSVQFCQTIGRHVAHGNSPYSHCRVCNGWFRSSIVVKGPAADATDAPQPWGLLCNPVMRMISFFIFPCNGAPVEWKWQGKTEVLGEKPVLVPLFHHILCSVTLSNNCAVYEITWKNMVERDRPQMTV
jgi:hypothetical protein